MSLFSSAVMILTGDDGVGVGGSEAAGWSFRLEKNHEKEMIALARAQPEPSCGLSTVA